MNLLYDELEDALGYRFRDRALLVRATNRLAAAKEDGCGDGSAMDGLATLGDAVIDVVVLEHLIAGGMESKGELSVTKMNMVNMTVLRRLAESIELHRYVTWGKGESGQEIWRSGRVLAECMEAVCGAAYLDGGTTAVQRVLAHLGFFP
ncbi:ribonuclease III [Methanogenium sp. S4BF]|uniref:ribonuclease III domain-containing protein n=1 Tax=Methanogenium sp. S4BF TaxID=1789226 RepID=UPI00241653BD|nr:ribonuclease III domain-containing protein [Methanogenium sp. S4BF]WFN34086.1 ribonuclease III [Methanogenium sp. S4BF]